MFSSHQNGLTPLHIAAHYGHVDIAQLLLDRNADTDARARVSSLDHPTLHKKAAPVKNRNSGTNEGFTEKFRHKRRVYREIQARTKGLSVRKFQILSNCFQANHTSVVYMKYRTLITSDQINLRFSNFNSKINLVIISD